MNQLEQLSAGNPVLSRDDTGRRQVEVAPEEFSGRMARRERMLTTMLASLNDFAYSFDRNGRFLFANQPLLNLWGMTLEEAVGKNFYDLKYPDELAARHQRELQEVFATGQSITNETPYTSPAGAKGYYEYIFSPALAADGTVEFVVGSTRDITERKKTEAALRQSEERLRLITNLVPHGIFAKDADGRHIFANPALAEMAGFSIEEMIGKTDFDLVADKAEAKAYRADDLAVIQSGSEMFIAEESRTDLSGRTRILQTIKIPFAVPETGGPAVLGICMDITERKRAEAALQQSEERFRSMFTAAATGIAISTPDGYFLEANAAYCQMLGYSLAELRTRNFASLTHPDDLTLNLQLRDEVLAGQRDSFVMEKRYLKKNGEIVWTRHSVSAVRAAGGKIMRLIVIVENITARKRAEETLRESEERFAGAFELAPIGMALVAPDGRWLKVNRAICAIVGYSEAELLTRTFQEITHPDDLAADLEKLHRLLAGEIRFYQMEKRYIHARGHFVTILLDVSLVRDGQGQPLYYIAQIQDITERKRVEKSLQSRQTELQALFDLMPAMLCFKDTQNNFLRVNERLAETAGKPIAEIEGKPAAEIFPRDAAKYYADDLEVIQSRTAKLGIIEQLQSPDGKDIWVQTDKVPVSDEDGKVNGIVVLVQDITERKRAEEQLLWKSAFLEAQVHSSFDGIMVVDSGRQLILQNQRLIDLWNIPEAFAGGVESPKRFHAVIEQVKNPRQFAEKVEWLYDHPDETGRDEIELVDGKILDRYSAPVRSKDGNYFGRIWSFRDITERKRTEERLLRLNRLHTVLSKVGVAVVRVRDQQELYDTVCRIVMEDGKLRMVFVAEVDAAAKLARPAASCGEGHEYLIAPTSTIPLDESPLSQGTVGTALRTGVPDFCNDIAGAARMKPWHETTQKHGLRANASFPFHLRGETVGVLVLYAGETGYFLEDEMRLMVSVASDISLALEALEKEQLRKQAEEKIQQLNAELEQRVIERTAQLEAANKELEAFSYSISHDLRAPLRAVNGFAGIVLQEFGAQVPPPARRHLERVCEGAKRMGELIDDLLAFSHLSRQSMSRRTVDSGKIVQAVLDETEPQREGRQIEINVGELPACQGDAALLKQVWVNLISNAIKYTRGRAPAVVEIGCEQKANENIFFVRDNGAGFDMQYAHKLFGVFQRLHRADEFEGTGVGLAIVQRIVFRHGGRIWAEAEAGKGATFYFTLEGETKS
jgi:PAS domain S-box-containing protein